MNEIIKHDVGDLCTDYSKIHGANVNLSRAIPLLLDGLKPVFRRLLVVMGVNIKLLPTGNTVKCSEIVGVVSKYHPHGDPIATLALLAQDFTFNLPLVTGQGNLGNLQGDKHSAARYIEAKLSPYAYDCFFSEYDSKILDMELAANKIDKIVTYLPCKYPNILINGNFGIGYGLSSSIPPYNPKEVMSAVIKLIKNPNANITLLPDLPTGCQIITNHNLERSVSTGKATFKMRAVAEVLIDEKINGKLENVIRITKIPYQVTTKSITDKIISLVEKKTINWIRDVHDDTKENDVDIKIILVKHANPYKCLESLFNLTDLETTFNINCTVVDNGEVIETNPRDLLNLFIENRREFKQRVLNNKIMRLETRALILDGLIKILSHKSFTKIMDEIRQNCTNRKDTTEYFINKFDISDVQAEKIADMSIYSLNKDNLNKCIQEKKEVEEESRALKDIRADKRILNLAISTEMAYGIDKYGYNRRCEIITEDEANNIVPQTKHTILVTKNGYIKKLDNNETTFGKFQKSDSIIYISPSVPDSHVLTVFSNLGMVYKLNIKDISDTNKISIGYKISELLKLVEGEEIVSVIDMSDTVKQNYEFLLSITENGLVKKTPVDMYSNSKLHNILGIKLNDDDKLSKIIPIRDASCIMIYTKMGSCIILDTNEVASTARLSKGVKAIKMVEGDVTQSVFEIGDTKKLLVVTTNNNMKIVDRPNSSARRSFGFTITSLDAGDYINKIIPVDSDVSVINFKLDNGDVVSREISMLPNKIRKQTCSPIQGINKTDCIMHIDLA